MRSYRELFRTPEYTPFFLSFAAQNAALTISGLALATLVYRATASPLLSAVSMFGPQLAQMLGATFFLSGATACRPAPPLPASTRPSRSVRPCSRSPVCRSPRSSPSCSCKA